MTFNENKTFWTEFIEFYREQRPLWDVKSKNYCNKHIRRECYGVLIEKAKEVFPASDEKLIKSKIESFRASFRRELKKVQNSKNKTGSAQDEVYEPSLWYYDLLLFTVDQEVTRKGRSSISPAMKRSGGEVSQDYEDAEEEEEAFNQSGRYNALDDSSRGPDDSGPPAITGRCSSLTYSATSSPLTTSASSSGTRSNRKRKNPLEMKQETFLDVATSVLCNQNRFKAFGNNVAFQLEDMDRSQQVITEKLISDVLIYGKLGNLRDHSAIVTQPKTHRNVNTYKVNRTSQFSANSQFQPQNNFQDPYQQPLNFDPFYTSFHNPNTSNSFPEQYVNEPPIIPSYSQHSVTEFSPIVTTPTQTGNVTSSAADSKANQGRPTKSGESGEKQVREELQSFLVLLNAVTQQNKEEIKS